MNILDFMVDLVLDVAKNSTQNVISKQKDVIELQKKFVSLLSAKKSIMISAHWLKKLIFKAL